VKLAKMYTFSKPPFEKNDIHLAKFERLGRMQNNFFSNELASLKIFLLGIYVEKYFE
jgi:hypothetical protein